VFCISRTSSTTGPHVRRPLMIALCAALLSLVSLGTTAAPAQAAVDPLLDGVTCPDQNTTFRDAYVEGQGWVPGWTYIERQRRAYVCLFNAVRAKIPAPKLSACSQDATYCDVGAVAVYTRQQVANLTTAAQWKSMEVDYMCATATGGNPHYACGRAANYWLNWWRDNNPGVSYTAWGEILNVGYPHLSTPRAVVNSWLSEPFDSTGHRRHREIILDGNYHYVGVGVTPAWYGNIAAGAPYNWGTFRQVISADFIN
jgi:Cysteine-rich secretory protein family